MRRALIGFVAVCTLSIVPAPSSAAASNGRIVMTEFGGGDARISSMLPDGTDVQPLYSVPQDWAVGNIDASKDGSKIAMSFLPGGDGHIYLMNADGTGFEQLTSGGDDAEPSFSPNGLRLSYIRYGARTDLYRVRTDGSNPTRLTEPGEPQADFASWSPDGKHIAFMRIGHKHQAIIITDPTGTTFDTIHRDNRRSGQFFTLDWSPDGSTIVFAQFNRSYLNADLYSIHADGTGLTRLTNSANVVEVTPSYSPDGSQIASSAQDPYGEWADIVIFDADGSNRNRIVLPRDQFHASWGG